MTNEKSTQHEPDKVAMMQIASDIWDTSMASLKMLWKKKKCIGLSPPFGRPNPFVCRGGQFWLSHDDPPPIWNEISLAMVQQSVPRRAGRAARGGPGPSPSRVAPALPLARPPSTPPLCA